MPLKLAFIGYNEEQTRRYFDEFRWMNRDQVEAYTRVFGKILLNDGTIIQRAPATKEKLDGLRFDQIIVACDRRGYGVWPSYQRELLHALEQRMSYGRVSEDDRIIYYDLDSELED